MTSQDPSPATAPDHPLVSRAPRWKIWVVRLVVFSLIFVFLMGAFGALGSLVERFFIAIYTD
ncbi:MAG: hypothetical protein QF570_16115 [Myxococcota bacterium]|jgi:hypothetical protein|nr:hypothetical protein [Myxococcota bacterium]